MQLQGTIQRNEKKTETFDLCEFYSIKYNI